MKLKCSFVVLLLISGLCSFAQHQNFEYTIKGTIQGVSSGKIYLAVYGSPGSSDSAEIRNGAFSFKGSSSEPSLAILCLERNYINKPMFRFFIDKGMHKVSLNNQDLGKGNIKGSRASAHFALLESIEESFDEQMQSLRKAARTDTSKQALEENEKAISLLLKKREAAQETFIRSHLGSPVAAYALQRNFGYSASKATKLEELYHILSPSLYYTSYAKEMKAAIDINNLLSIGKMAPAFTQNDSAGKPVSLADFRGKYVLLDFWASWCGPCRKDNPNIVKAFHQFQDKGFTVLGVSLDRPGKKQDWLNAIQQDGLTWTHVSDLKFWNNEVAKQYGIKSIPSNFLIGPDGRIIARNLRGEELGKTLEKILN